MNEGQHLERALLAHPSVAECAAVAREAGSGDRQWVAFLVPSGPVSAPELTAHLAASGAAATPAAMVPVSAIPLDAAGAVDREALLRLEVLDADVERRWQEWLAGRAGVDEAVVLLEEAPCSRLPLHLCELLPEARFEAPERRAGAPVAAGGGPAVAASGERPPAVADGGAIEARPGDPVTLADSLRNAAAGDAERGLVYASGDGSEELQSYAGLLARARCVLAGLRDLGLEPGDRLLFQYARPREFIEAFWGAVLGGFVPVPMAVAPSYRERNSALQTLAGAWRLLERPLVLTSADLVADIASLAREPEFEGLRVASTGDMADLVPDPREHPARPDDLALLMLTSGSTGSPKGVMLSHSNLLGRAAGSRQMNGYSADDVSVNWMPLDHVAGLIYFHLRDVFTGCRQVHVPTGVVIEDALRWPALLDRYRATVTFAPNFAFGLVNDRERDLDRFRWDLSCVRHVLNGAESIVARTARRFLELLGPHGLSPDAMRPAWGMSETSSGVTYSDRFSLESTSDDDPFVEVGRPIPGVSLRIADANDRILAEGEVGRLQVRGVTVTSGYLDNPELNDEAFTADGWFVTGDLATLDDGRLTITGREKDVVIINSVNYYCHAIESAVEELDDVETSYTAACAVREPGTDTDGLAIFFHSPITDERRLAELVREVRARVVEKIGVTPRHVIPVAREDVPKTSIGKIQRAPLAQRLEAGRFESTLRHVDRILGNANTVPDWFFSKRWCRAEAPAGEPLAGTRRVLLFTDALGVGAALARRLERAGATVLAVEPGASFERLAPGRFRVRPDCPADYDRLLDACGEPGDIGHVAHLWGCTRYRGEPDTPEALLAAQHEGLYSLLWLAGSLSRAGGGARPVRIVVAASHAQPVAPGEPVAYEKSPVLGLVKSIPQELPWAECRHVDLVAGEDPDVHAAALAHELCAPHADREVAYRDGDRFVARLERVEFREERAQPLPFVKGGSYVVTGGLGGIGEEVARYLLREHGARVLLLGRTRPGAADPDPGAARRAAVYQALQSLGDVDYRAVDVCDRGALESAVARHEARWGRPVDGVFHLAGTYREGLAVDEDAASVDAALRARVLGTWTLHEVLRGRTGTLFVCFSSVAGYFGGASVGAYSAANNFLEAFSAHQQRHGGLDHYCFAWSTWEGIGQSRDYPAKDLPRSRGYQAMSRAQAMCSLLIGMRHRERGLVVGLDAHNRHVRRHVLGQPYALQALRGYYTASGARGAPDPAGWAAPDRFGTPTSCRLVRVAEMPRLPGGAIDRESLRLAGGRQGEEAAERTAPRTGLEQALADLWKQVLSVPRVALEDSFFELGGDSILAVRVLGRIRDATGVDLSVRDFFEASTLANLARAVALVQDRGSASPGPVAEPGGGEGEADETLAEGIEQLSDAQVEELLDRMTKESEGRP